MMLDIFGLFVIYVFVSYAESSTVANATKERALNVIKLSNFASFEKTRQVCDVVLKTMDESSKAGNKKKTFTFNLDTKYLLLSFFLLNQHTTQEQFRLSFLVGEENSTEVINILQGIVDKNTTLADTKTILNSSNLSIVTFHAEKYLQVRDDLRASLKKAKRNGDVFDVAIELQKFRPVVNAFRGALDKAAIKRGLIFVCGKQCPNELEAIQELMATKPVMKKHLQAGIQTLQDFVGVENNSRTMKTFQELTGMEENSPLVKVAEETIGEVDISVIRRGLPLFFQLVQEMVAKTDDKQLEMMDSNQLMSYFVQKIFQEFTAQSPLGMKVLDGLENPLMNAVNEFLGTKENPLTSALQRFLGMADSPLMKVVQGLMATTDNPLMKDDLNGLVGTKASPQMVDAPARFPRHEEKMKNSQEKTGSPQTNADQGVIRKTLLKTTRTTGAGSTTMRLGTILVVAVLALLV